MPVSTYVGREATITKTPSGGAAEIIGVAETCELEVVQNIIPVYGNSYVPADLKEDTQEVRGTLRKAFVDAKFYESITRNGNGYLTGFDVEFKVKDKSGASPYPFIKHTVATCRATKWKLSIPNKGGVLVEELEFIGTTYAATTGTEA